MADDDTSKKALLAKIEKADGKIKAARAKLTKIGEDVKGSVHGLAVVAGVPIRAAAAYAAGYADAMVGSERNQHPVSIVSGLLGVVGGGIAAALGQPTAGALAVDVGSGPLDGLSWSKGYEMGSRRKSGGPQG